MAAYVRLHEAELLRARAAKAVECLKECRLCPRQCGVDRTAGQLGACGIGRNAVVASAQPHFGEESVLVGQSGSGTIFFSGCNLLCTFCQNYEISRLREGVAVTAQELSGLMLRVARHGCHNINLVTPSHVVPQILEALVLAAEQGLNLPLVFNSGGYDSVETLRLLDGVVDIYMPDFKFWDGNWADHFCRAPDYPDLARDAIREMHRQVGDLQVGDDGVATRGLLVRHLVMPGGVAGTVEIMTFLAREVSVHTYVNVMAQYRPCGRAVNSQVAGRRPTREEYAAAVAAAQAAGLTRLDGM